MRRTRPIDPADLTLVGPYERWVFSPAGGSGGGAPGDPEKALYASLGELPPGHPHLATGVVSAIGVAPAPGAPDQRPRQYSPTIWAPGVAAPGPADSCFAPLIVDLRAHAASSGVSLTALDRGLASAGDGELEPEFGRRLNHTIPPESFDPQFDRNGPEIVADAEIRAAAKSATSGAPLVLLAVIDDGLPFAQSNVRLADGRPRVECCWLQSAAAASRPSERTVLFGREHTRQGIAALLAAHPGDEDAVYRAAGQLSEFSPMTGTVSHGALVLDLAAGRRPGDPLSPVGDLARLRLICVQLPSPAIMDTVGFGKDAFVLSAFHYVFERADRIERAYGLGPLPLVVNFSFGFTAGPHDGTDRLEEAINTLVAARRATGRETRLVMPAGNHFAARLHGVIDKSNAPAGVFDIHWRCQPDDKTANYLEVWYPEDGWPATDGASPPKLIEIATPFGAVLRPMDSQPDQSFKDPPQHFWDIRIAGRIVGQLSVDKHRSDRWRLMLVLAPTATRSGRGVAAPSGLWRLRLDVAALRDKPIHCRIQRDTNPLHPELGARQSYFDDPRDRHLDGSGRPLQTDEGAFFARRFATLNGLATHKSVDVVAGYVRDSDRRCPVSQRPKPALYGSCGPANGAAPGGSGTVDSAAPSDTSSVLPGVRGAGTRSAAISRLSGTSAAAPQMARAIAMELLDPGSMASRLVVIADPTLRPRLGKEYLRT